MKTTPDAIARAIVDMAHALPPQEHGALVQAAIEVMTSHGLLRFLPSLPSLVERRWNEKEGIVPVKLTTVTGDAGPAKHQLLSAIETALKRPCVLEERADPSIIGGLLIAVEDERFDATLRRALQELGRRLRLPVQLPA